MEIYCDTLRHADEAGWPNRDTKLAGCAHGGGLCEGRRQMYKGLRSKLLKGRGGADVDFQNAPLLQERSGCSEMAVRKSWELLRTIVKDGKTRSCIFFHSFPLQNVRLRGLQSCIACSCDVPSLWTMTISRSQLVLK